MTTNPHICAASDCSNKLNDKMSSAKYCSNQCKWREHKRSVYQQRKDKGLCPQCGGDMDAPKNSASYCGSCQKYYRERYYDQKVNN